MYIEELFHALFGVKTLSETLFSAPLMKPGYGARHLLRADALLCVEPGPSEHLLSVTVDVHRQHDTQPRSDAGASDRDLDATQALELCEDASRMLGRPPEPTPFRQN